MTVPACQCGQHLAPHDFRDELSWREYDGLSALCQACQDTVFMAFRDDGVPPHRYELRSGALVATRTWRDRPLDVVLIPFVFGAPGRPVGWEVGSIVYARRSLSPSQLSDRLGPMRSVLGRHHAWLRSVTHLGIPAPGSRYGPCVVVIGRDAETLRLASAASREVADAGQVPLEPLLRERGYGSLDAFVSRTGVDLTYRAAGADPLRVCAWLGAALELGRPDPCLFECVLAPFRVPASGSRAPVTEGS